MPAATSFSITNIPSADVIKYTLRNTEAAKVPERLISGLERLKHDKLDQLFKLLVETGYIAPCHIEAANDPATRHCQRCHNNYLERDNELTACRIKHSDSPEIVHYPVPALNDSLNSVNHYVTPPTNMNGEVVLPVVVRQSFAMRLYKCCGLRTKLGEDAGFCVLDRHTTRAENVRYNDMNIRTCETLGCHCRLVYPDQAAGRVPDANAAFPRVH
ncbi:hypothetical protein H0H93_011208 [Arthromyces matolae]|nr:hypothetical protein H0H93_011208 [Arthromyces matolae]